MNLYGASTKFLVTSRSTRVAGKQSANYIESVGHRDRKHRVSRRIMKKEFRIDHLLIRQVSELVSAAANEAAASHDDELELELHLYRTLAVNCQTKADMTANLIQARNARSNTSR